MSDLDYADHPRTIWYPANTKTGRPAGDPIVRNSAGSPRPRLKTPLDTFAVHYIGSGRTWLDAGDTGAELAGIEKWHAIPKDKPNEYNSASDSNCETWGYAGPFQAAHASGHNTTAWGHLVVYGLEQPTEDQAQKLIAGVRRMRRQLVLAKFLTPDHKVRGHREISITGTTCPGPLFENRAWWKQIVAPLNLTYPDPTPVREEDAMNTPIIRVEGYADQFLCIPLSAETKARLQPTTEQAAPVVLTAKDRAAFLHRVGYPLSPMPGE